MTPPGPVLFARRMLPAITLVLALGAGGCGAGTPDGEGPDAGTPGSSAGVSDSVPPDRTPQGSGTADDVAPPGDAPADERATATGAIAGAEWTAGETRRELSVEGAALLRAIRTASHADFDRIVLDFGEAAVPGYRVAYIDRPVRQCGSGNVVELAGEGWLSITVQPANAHTEAGVATATPRDRSPGLPVLLELRMVCDFEAMVEVVGGVASPERYRVFVLEDPNRLVVDIRH